jgi:hypothetical protein
MVGMNDPIEPPYYKNRNIQPIDVIEDWVLPPHLANVVKYIGRYRERGQPIIDLQKACWYMNRFTAMIIRLEVEEKERQVQEVSKDGEA